MRPTRHPDDRNPGVGVLIRDGRGRFLLQRKDATHPEPRARGLLSFFGGSLEPGEDPEDGLARELREELRDPLTIAEILAAARFRRRFRLRATPWPGEYDLYVFEAVVDPETLARWADEVLAPGAVLEGTAVSLRREELGEFLCSQGEVVALLASPGPGG